MKKAIVKTEADIVDAVIASLQAPTLLPQNNATPNVPSGIASFVAQTLSTPVALTAEQKAEMKAELDAIKTKFGVKVAIVAKEPRAPAIVQNGQRRPGSDGLCGQAWAMFDRMTAQQGRPVTIGEALIETEKTTLRPGNVKAEYACWRKFNGIIGRLPKAGQSAKASGVVADASYL